jgi:hypothetical protein
MEIDRLTNFASFRQPDGRGRPSYIVGRAPSPVQSYRIVTVAWSLDAPRLTLSADGIR